MTDAPQRSVCYTVPVLSHYRVAFHEQVRQHLAARGVTYRLIHSPAFGNALTKQDTVTLPWAEVVPCTVLRLFGREAYWQHWGRRLRGADLVILAQESSLLRNYAVLLGAAMTRQKVAWFGHGRNFQSKAPNDIRARWKRFWATRVDWWFAYTEGSADVLRNYGFPPSRITVFENAIDLGRIAVERAMISADRQRELRDRMLGGSRNVAVYVGGIYAEKRIPFLIGAADAIRSERPDFHLIVIGSGPEAHLIDAAAATRPWLHAMGPRFGMEKTELVSLARVWMMPGLVGLAVLDSFAYETPLVTTDLPIHSPEIEYLRSGENGVMVAEAEDVAAYARGVLRVLLDDIHHGRLVEGARQARARHSIEHMAAAFADGVMRALAV